MYLKMSMLIVVVVVEFAAADVEFAQLGIVAVGDYTVG